MIKKIQHSIGIVGFTCFAIASVGCNSNQVATQPSGSGTPATTAMGDQSKNAEQSIVEQTPTNDQIKWLAGSWVSCDQPGSPNALMINYDPTNGVFEAHQNEALNDEPLNVTASNCLLEQRTSNVELNVSESGVPDTTSGQFTFFIDMKIEQIDIVPNSKNADTCKKVADQMNNHGASWDGQPLSDSVTIGYISQDKAKMYYDTTNWQFDTLCRVKL
ncbi:MAG: hypothetical protein P4M08_13860 [Oligoflexia bacterium]|nr:hypothetical protein [Oligoflexia bacterium]